MPQETTSETELRRSAHCADQPGSNSRIRAAQRCAQHSSRHHISCAPARPGPAPFQRAARGAGLDKQRHLAPIRASAATQTSPLIACIIPRVKWARTAPPRHLRILRRATRGAAQWRGVQLFAPSPSLAGPSSSPPSPRPEHYVIQRAADVKMTQRILIRAER